MEVENEYEGYGLFNDIEDIVLRTRNRAITMANIFGMYSKDGLLSARGVSLLHNYFGAIERDERAGVFVDFLARLQSEGVEFDMVQMGVEE